MKAKMQEIPAGIGTPDARKRACPVRGALDGNLLPKCSKALSFDPGTLPETSFVNNVDLHQAPSHDDDTPPQGTHALRSASGEKAQARAILAATRTLQAVEQAQRPATPDECAVLAR